MEERNLGVKIGRGGFAVGFIFWVDLFAGADVCLGFIPRNGNIVGLDFADDFEGETSEAVDAAGGCAVGEAEAGHGVVATVEDGFAVDDDEFFHS